MASSKKIAGIGDVKLKAKIYHNRPQDSYNILTGASKAVAKPKNPVMPTNIDLITGLPKAQHQASKTNDNASDFDPITGLPRQKHHKGTPTSAKLDEKNVNLLTGQQISPDAPKGTKVKKGSIREFLNDDAKSIDPITFQSKNAHLDIRNVPTDVPVSELERLFNQWGGLKHVNLVTTNRGVSKGYGLVTMESHEAAQKAIEELDGFQIKSGTRMRVSVAKMKNASA